MMQAKDIPDGAFLGLIATVRGHAGRWTNVGDFEYARPDWPRKVVLAKARKLIRRGLITGCACGCRGDFELTLLGSRLLIGMVAGKSSTLAWINEHTDIRLEPWQAHMIDRWLDSEAATAPSLVTTPVPEDVWRSAVAPDAPALVVPVSIADLDAWASGRTRRTT